MKKLTTIKLMVALLVLMNISAVQAVNEIKIPEDYPMLAEAIAAIVADLEKYPADSEIHILIAEGTFTVGYNPDGTRNQDYLAPRFGRALAITIEGAGADKTVIKGYEDEQVPVLGNTSDRKGMRFFQTHVDNAGLDLIIKNIKFLNWGFYHSNVHGGIINYNQDAPMKLSFINCEFESIAARGGTIIHATVNSHDIYVDNIFVHNCVNYESGNMVGIMTFNGTGNVVVKNSLFMSNILMPKDIETGVDQNRREGGIIRIFHPDANNYARDMVCVIENNAFIDNKVVNDEAIAKDVEYPVVSVNHSGGAAVNTGLEVTFKNNIFMENRREPGIRDVDLLVIEDDRLAIVDPGEAFNIMNSYVLGETQGGTEMQFRNVTPRGFKVNDDYSYTHEDIMFTMDGELPALLVDEHGVAYVEYSGDGGIVGVMVTSIEVTSASDQLLVAGSMQMEAIVEPENADEKGVIWSVELGSGVAMINEAGMLMGMIPGTVTARANAVDGSGVSGSKLITIVSDNTYIGEAPWKLGFKVFPNPSDGLFEIVSPLEGETMYEAYDLLGNLVKKGFLLEGNNQINMSNLTKGVYLLRVNHNDQYFNTRLLIQ